MDKHVFQAVRISDTVYWVGAVDWGLRDFHGYLTSRGTTYNAYLILADRITLVDTVKAPFKNEMLERISNVVAPEDISVVISNHSEMDHTGCLPYVIDHLKPDVVYASSMGAKALAAHFGIGKEITVVGDGEKVSLGNVDVVFMETRMLHWPDSMFTYLPSERILFSQDAFGMHLASYERFADEMESSVLDFEAAKYFANILLPYAALIPKAIKKAAEAGIEPLVIAPDHGPVWRREEDLKKILDRYLAWSEQKPNPKALVVYDSMWGSTALMARVVCEGLEAAGASVKLMSLKDAHRSDVATEVLDAGALLVGSSTINNGVFPTVADVMSYLKGLRPKNLIGAVFGSYGWSGEAVKLLEALFDEMKIERVGESVRIEYVPGEDALRTCFELGRRVGWKLMEKAG